MTGRRLRSVTGWALILAAGGIFVDSWASWTLDANSPDWLVSLIAPGGRGNGSIGLIPAYLGATLGLVGLVVVLRRAMGTPVAMLAAIGVSGTFAFWYSYPARATFGGLGSIAIGIALLTLPMWGRLASPLWVASGVMGIPELVRPGINWGPIASFTLLGAAIAVTGAYVLWGERAHTAFSPTRHTASSDPGASGALNAPTTT